VEEGRRRDGGVRLKDESVREWNQKKVFYC
jgi:hypothetical protein